MKKKQKMVPTPPPLLCICCTQIVLQRRDKYLRPYITCPSCGMKYFFKSEMAEEGYQLVSELIYSVFQAHTAELQRRYAGRIMAKQAQQEMQASQGVAPKPEKLPRRRKT